MTQKNAVIYVDYENIYETLYHYGVNLLEIDFFPVILDRLKTVHQINPIKCNVYFNLNKFNPQHQNILQKLGLTLCPSMNKGKNSSDLMLAVDAITTLYENPTIDVFVIISSDRDMSPILSTVRCKGKLTYILTEKKATNPGLISEADIHEFVEDVFGLIGPQGKVFLTKMGRESITYREVSRARQVSMLLYSSEIWKICEERQDPLTFEGYLHKLTGRLHRGIDVLKKDFEVANCLGYVSIYRDEVKRCLCLKKGENYEEIATLQEQEGDYQKSQSRK
jgi:uncharacterized LabA/DUF88 family protein